MATEQFPVVNYPKRNPKRYIDEYRLYAQQGEGCFTDIKDTKKIPTAVLEAFTDISSWFSMPEDWSKEGVLVSTSSETQIAAVELGFVFHSLRPQATYPHDFLYRTGFWGGNRGENTQPGIDLQRVLKPEFQSGPVNRYNNEEQKSVAGYDWESYYIDLSADRVGPYYPFDDISQSEYAYYLTGVRAHPFHLYLAQDTRVRAAADPQRIKIVVTLEDAVPELEETIATELQERTLEREILQARQEALLANLAEVNSRLEQLDPLTIRAEQDKAERFLQRVKQRPNFF